MPARISTSCSGFLYYENAGIYRYIYIHINWRVTCAMIYMMIYCNFYWWRIHELLSCTFCKLFSSQNYKLNPWGLFVKSVWLFSFKYNLNFIFHFDNLNDHALLPFVSYLITLILLKNFFIIHVCCCRFVVTVLNTLWKV